jgi:hypothetical protein
MDVLMARPSDDTVLFSQPVWKGGIWRGIGLIVRGNGWMVPVQDGGFLVRTDYSAWL